LLLLLPLLFTLLSQSYTLQHITKILILKLLSQYVKELTADVYQNNHRKVMLPDLNQKSRLIACIVHSATTETTMFQLFICTFIRFKNYRFSNTVL